MNINMIIGYVTKAVIGALALFLTVKSGNAFAKSFKVGNNWISSTSMKGLLFKGVAGFALMQVLPYISDLVNSLVNQLNLGGSNNNSA